jgi:hypothetical protein
MNTESPRFIDEMFRAMNGTGRCLRRRLSSFDGFVEDGTRLQCSVPWDPFSARQARFAWRSDFATGRQVALGGVALSYLADAWILLHLCRASSPGQHDAGSRVEELVQEAGRICCWGGLN